MAFRDIFKKSNDYNEKVVIGFLAFLVMVFAFGVNMVASWLGKKFEINEYIFNAFMYITVGSFLPDVWEKFAGIGKNKQVPKQEDEPKE